VNVEIEPMKVQSCLLVVIQFSSVQFALALHALFLRYSSVRTLSMIMKWDVVVVLYQQHDPL
jgi:hypothetical protein